MAQLKQMINKNKFYIIGTLILFLFLFYCSTKLCMNVAPDEYMRYDIPLFIYNHSYLPKGDEKEILNAIWGFSYGFTPYLPSIISFFFMKIASIFTTTPVHLLIAARLTSVLAGALTFFVCCKIGEEIFNHKMTIYLFAIFVSLLPQFMYLSLYLNNDSFSIFATALIVYGWIKGIKTNWNCKWCIFLGVAIGLCALTYYNAYGFILCSIIVYCMSSYKLNYEKNFFIPIALSGNTNFNKDNLRRFVSEGNLIIPGASTIQFDEISKKRIFEAIDFARFNDIKYIKDSYKELKAKLGKIPALKEFEEYGAIDVQRIFQNKSLGSYHEFLKKYEKEYKVTFSKQEEEYLKFISTKLSTGKRVQELETIRLAIEKKVNLMNYLKEEMKNTYNITIPDVGYETIQNILTQNFATGTGKDTYKDIKIIDEHNNISPNFSKLLLNHEFKRQILEVVDYAIDQYKKEYSERYKDTDLCLYKKYTYEDVCQLLNWEKSLVPLNIGGYKYDEHTNTLPVFINYDKEENISDTIKYTDHFIDSQTLVAMSKSKMKLDSKGMDIFNKAHDRNTFIHIFVRKNKDDKISKEFYYLGQGKIIDIKQETMANDVPVCEILYQLDQPVRRDIYDYIVNN